MTPETFAALVLTRLSTLVAALVVAGWPALSPWWSSLIERFMGAAVRQLVARVGRRGGKSSTACVFAVAFALVYSTLGLVPPGDTGWVVFVSVRHEEALERLRAIAKILTTIGVAFEPGNGDSILIAGTNIGFRVQSCTVASVVGWTTILIIADEVARWRDKDSGANPATEVLAALRPTMATQEHARILLLSSPLSYADAHAKAFDAGDDDFQLTARAETWVSNPRITEAATHALERDERIWLREYAAIPQAAQCAAFDAAAVERAFTQRDDGTPLEKALIIDASSGKKDAWTWLIAGWVKSERGDYIRIDTIDGIRGSFWDQIPGDKLVARVATVATVWNAKTVHGDQRESYMLRSEFARHGREFFEHTYTATSKPAAVERLRRWLADGTLSICAHDELRAELLAFEERVTANGAFTFGARGDGHDDFACLLLTLALADLSGTLPIAGEVRTHMGSFQTCPAFEDRPLESYGDGAPYTVNRRHGGIPAEQAGAAQGHSQALVNELLGGQAFDWRNR